MLELSGTAHRQLIAFFEEHGLDAAGLPQTLGTAYEALYTQFPGAIYHVLPQLTPAQQLGLQVFFLHQPVSRDTAVAGLGSLVPKLLDAGLLRCDDADMLHCDYDVRQITPVTAQHHAGWVVAHRDASMTDDFVPSSEHVPGIGQASYSLLAGTPVTPVETLLDLGCGSGVLSIALAQTAEHITATDISLPALELAAASCACSDVTAELLAGSWFEPVQGRTFDRIVANPPFVIGPPEIHHVYKDSGLALDGATEFLVRNVTDYLNPGGQAFLLGSWALQADEDPVAKLSAWVPDTGVCAWVGQRSLVSVEQYVQTWLEDESIDPRSPAGIARTQQWLDYFASKEITTIGLGLIALEKLADATETSEVDLRVIAQRDSYYGYEVAEYFRRAAWLRTVSVEEVLSSIYQLRPCVSLESAQTLTHSGFSTDSLRLVRNDGIHYQQECPAYLQALLSGLGHGTLPLSTALQLLAHATGIDPESNTPEVLEQVVRLVASGILLPTALLAEEDA